MTKIIGVSSTVGHWEFSPRFGALKKCPELFNSYLEQRSAERKLTIWSAACSSGQEPYSLAILLCEHFPALAAWEIRILATDLSQEMAQRTQQGRYSQLEINRGLPAPLMLKYFEQHGLEWQIKEELRRMVEVRELNLAKDWGYLPPLDIILMRNVMIYFDPAMKKTILAKLRQLLRPQGYLFLGGAETTLNLDDSFTRVQFDKASYYQVRRDLSGR